jgi:phage terminase large subunit-like protein
MAKDGYSPIALVGQTKADVRDTMIELGESSILKVSAPWFMPEYEPSKRRLTWQKE